MDVEDDNAAIVRYRKLLYQKRIWVEFFWDQYSVSEQDVEYLQWW